MDPLSDVLRTLSAQSTLYFRAVLGMPWSLAVPEYVRVIRFHVAVQGSCFVETQGAGCVELRQGDLALIPHGSSHVLSSRPGMDATPLSDVLEDPEMLSMGELRFGGIGASTTLVCGHFAITDELSHPLLERLPPLIHVRAEDGHDFLWLDAATRALGREAARRPPGWEVMVARISEILFIQALRTQLGDGLSSSAVAAFLDPNLSLALCAIHSEPQREWKVETLARLAGMSRTSFAVHFRELMGMPPLGYVTQWRMQRARAFLLGSDFTVATIAEQVGYASEAAFSRAFQRLYGSPPATYRRNMSAVV